MVVDSTQTLGTRSQYLVQVRDLRTYFPARSRALGRNAEYVRAVDGVSFDILRGSTLGLVGESGCGKSTTGRVVLQLYPATAGHVYFEGQDLTTLQGEPLRQTRNKMQMIFQDPYA